MTPEQKRLLARIREDQYRRLNRKGNFNPRRSKKLYDALMLEKRGLK